MGLEYSTKKKNIWLGKSQWANFNRKINEVVLVRNLKDKIIWKGSPNGIYSSKSYCRSVSPGNLNDKLTWKAVWEGLALPNCVWIRSIKKDERNN